jgi:hypothetical protein
VLGEQCRRRAAGFQTLRQALVDPPLPRPGDVFVERLADQRVAEARPPGAQLRQQAPFDRLFDPCLIPGKLAHQIEVEGEAGDRRHLHRVAGRTAERLGAEQDRIAHGVRDRQLVPGRQLQPLVAGLQPPARRQRSGQLLHKKGHARGASVERGRQHRADGAAKHLGCQRGRILAVERCHHQLAEAAQPAEVGAHATHRMAARDLVAAIGAEQEQRLALERPGQRGQQLQGRVVGPVQIIEEDNGGRAPGDRGKGPAQRLEEGRAVALRGRRPKLGEQAGEVAGERGADQQRGLIAQPGAQRGGDRAIRDGTLNDRLATEDVEVSGGERFIDEPRLADARLARQQQQAALTIVERGQRRRQHAQFAFAPHERPVDHERVLLSLVDQHIDPRAPSHRCGPRLAVRPMLPLGGERPGVGVRHCCCRLVRHHRRPPFASA